jgi:hypothetical protein
MSAHAAGAAGVPAAAALDTVDIADVLDLTDEEALVQFYEVAECAGENDAKRRKLDEKVRHLMMVNTIQYHLVVLWPLYCKDMHARRLECLTQCTRSS